MDEEKLEKIVETEKRLLEPPKPLALQSLDRTCVMVVRFNAHGTHQQMLDAMERQRNFMEVSMHRTVDLVAWAHVPKGSNVWVDSQKFNGDMPIVEFMPAKLWQVWCVRRYCAHHATPGAGSSKPTPEQEGAITMNRSQLVKAVAAHTEFDQRDVNEILYGLQEVVTAVVSKGEPITITGFIKFAKVDRPARMGRNPQTGEQIKIKASKKARLTPLKKFKDAVINPRLAPKVSKDVWPG